jgi:carnitine O-acetyltransferase
MTETTFSMQSTIPRLPIPTLVETTTKYLSSLLPIATPEQFAQTKAVVADFIKPGGFGETLQKRLQARDAGEKQSWLEEWWFQMAYLSWPDPIMVNSNWFILFTDNPRYSFPSPPTRGQFTKEQVQRAACIVNGYVEYCDLLKKEEIGVEKTKQGPLCMWQYEQLFGLYRVPGTKGDHLIGTFPETLKETHIAVLVKDQLFKMPVYTLTGQRVKVAELRRSLEDIINQVNSLAKEEVQPPIGVFTGWNRPGWAKVRTHMQSSAANKAAFEVIENSLFCVALDDYSVGSIVGNARTYRS